jgi:hypothetical protein
MRLSSLLVAVFLLVPPVLWAQHSSAGASSSGSSSTSSSSSVSSHSSSGGSSSASSSSSSHSSGSHSSGASASRGSSARSTAGRPIENGTKAPGSSAAKSSKNPEPEHGRFYAFLRHPFRKPVPKLDEADLRHRPCPPGKSGGKNGGCVANTTSASNQCPSGEAGASCADTGSNRDVCATVHSQATTAVAELRSINAEMQTACSGNAAGQDCGGLRQRHDAAVERYRALLNGADPKCRGTLLDPSAL